MNAQATITDTFSLKLRANHVLMSFSWGCLLDSADIFHSHSCVQYTFQCSCSRSSSGRSTWCQIWTLWRKTSKEQSNSCWTWGHGKRQGGQLMHTRMPWTAWGRSSMQFRLDGLAVTKTTTNNGVHSFYACVCSVSWDLCLISQSLPVELGHWMKKIMPTRAYANHRYIYIRFALTSFWL